MIDIIKSIFDSVYQFFSSVYDFISTGIYDFAVWISAQLVETLTVRYFETKLWAIGFSWDIAQQIMLDLHVADYLGSAWAALDPEVAGLLSILRVPDAILIILAGLITRYVLRFLPGL